MKPFLTAIGLLAAPLAAAVLRVRVVDPQGAAIPRATVEVRPVTVLTDMEGLAEVDAEPPARLRVSAPGFSTRVERIDAAPAGLFTLKLEPAPLVTTFDVLVRETPGAGPATASAVEIDRTVARTVFDAVEQLAPGAFVTRRGVMGYGIATNGTGVVSIRGVGGQPNTGVLVVIDGRPDFQGLMGHPLPDFYSLSDAGSVSVTQGPASVLYGSNAMGGVIEVKASRPPRGSSTRLISSLGSFLTGQHRLTHWRRREKWFYSAAAGVAHTRGDRSGSAFRDQDGAISLGADLSPVWRTALDGRYGLFYIEDPGPVGTPLAGSYARVGRGGYSLSLDNSAGRTWGYARLYSSHGRHFITDGFRSTDSATGGRLHQYVTLGPRLTVEGGTDVTIYGGRARNVAARLDYGEHSLRTAAGFARVEGAPAGRLRLHSGLRHEDNSLLGGITVPEFGASVQLSDRYAVSAAAGRGFRNPTLRELYLFPAPNPLLKPEHLWNYQATFQARPVSSLAASLTAYYADLTNLIVVTGRFPNLKLANAGSALNRGWEANLRWRPARQMAVQSGYAWLRSNNLGPYIPRHRWNYSAEFDLKRAFVHFGGATVGRRWADAGRRREMEAYSLASLKLTAPIRHGCSLFIMVDNVFNRRYEVVAGYPMPAVNVAGGFTVGF